MFHFIFQSLHSFTQVATQNLVGKNAVFISIGYGHDAIKRLQERAANL
jgi:hypothetical protein